MTLKSIFGFAGTVVGLGLSLAPIPTMIDIIKNKSIGDYSPFPYAVTLVQNLMWVLYGRITPNRDDIVIANSLSAIVELSYCIIFWFYAKTSVKRRHLAWLHGGSVAFILIVVSFAKAVESGISVNTSLGIMASALNALMYGSPLAVLKVVIQTRSVRYMPFLLSFMTLMCAVIWFAWALVANDVFVLIPNILGLGLGIAQMVVWFYYRRFGVPDNDDEIITESMMEEDVELIE
ncbi:sugar transporter [Perkinsus chesapeaki]|uniref:Sugar transporter n=1 Tax=Perkinsus chesapeaki TaxID=330153 RepID=A0A7J6KR48_PERCH|nr:sugar transporter [Perkinsus chesapeaki]